MPPNPEEDTQQAPSDPEGETREAPSDSAEEKQETPPDPNEETWEAPSDPELDTKDEGGLAAASTDLEGPVVPARRKLIISGNLPSINIIAHVVLTGARRRGKSSAATTCANDRRSPQGRRRVERVGVRRRGSMILQRKVEIPEPIARDMSPKQ